MNKIRRNILKNNSGFTLVELLVAITIFAIITAMAFPLIRNMVADNKKNKYTTYQKTLEESAKLYIDSYGEDIFGKNNHGCKVISYDEIASKNLLKDINLNSESCFVDKTSVRVTKLNNDYKYEVGIKCQDKDGKVVYEDLLDETVTCEVGQFSSGPKINFTPTEDPTGGAENTTKNKIVDIIVSSQYGIMGDGDIYYGWSTDPYSENVTSWTKQDISEEDSNKINWSKKVTVKTDGFDDGAYFLHVRTVDDSGVYSIKDIIGTGSKEKYYVSGPYIVDKNAGTPPSPSPTPTTSPTPTPTSTPPTDPTEEVKIGAACERSGNSICYFTTRGSTADAFASSYAKNSSGTQEYDFDVTIWFTSDRIEWQCYTGSNKGFLWLTYVNKKPTMGGLWGGFRCWEGSPCYNNLIAKKGTDPNVKSCDCLYGSRNCS